MHLKTVHFVGVILGQIYVAAEFVDGTTRHFWLQHPPAWQADTIYELGAVVQPSVPNGYYYQAPVSSPAQAWQPGTVYPLGAQVQPTVPDGYVYTVVQVTGTNPTSGTTEPAWPGKDGAQVFEGIEETSVPSAGTTPTGGTEPINSAIRDRYNLKPSGDV